jgi:membrane-associated progesterone receptor component
MADTDHVAEPKNFAPKTPVNLDPPKDDPISQEELSKCDGMTQAMKNI